MAAAIILDSKPGEQPTDGAEDADKSMLRTDRSENPVGRMECLLRLLDP